MHLSHGYTLETVIRDYLELRLLLSDTNKQSGGTRGTDHPPPPSERPPTALKECNLFFTVSHLYVNKGHSCVDFDQQDDTLKKEATKMLLLVCSDM